MENNVIFIEDYLPRVAAQGVKRFEGPGTLTEQNSGDGKRSVFGVNEKPRLRGKKARPYPPEAESVGEAAKRVIAKLEKRAGRPT